MNFSLALVYVALYFLIAHIRWIAPIYNNRLVYATPLVLCFLISPAIPFIRVSQAGSKYNVYWCAFFALAVLALPSFDTTYLIQGIIVFVTLFCVPITCILVTQAARLLGDPKGGPRILFLLSVAGVLQTIWMTFENKLGLRTFFRPNMEGSAVEWWFTNRAGADRARYTFASPMIAGSWAWFSGLILMAFGGLGNWSKMLRLYFAGAGLVSWIAIILSISRGPALVALVSLIVFCIPLLKHASIIRVTIFVLPSIIGAALLSNHFLDQSITAAVIDVAANAFDPGEAGNISRLKQWETGLGLIGQSPANGNGLHSISYLMAEECVNFENTVLDVIYALGLAGWLYCTLLIGTWIVLLARLAFQVYIDSHMQPAKVFALAAGAGWFPYLFMFPCLQQIETAFITFSVFAMLCVEPWLSQSGANSIGRGRLQIANSRAA